MVPTIIVIGVYVIAVSHDMELTDDIGTITVSPPCWLTYHDLDRWSENGQEVPTISSTTWQFESHHHRHESSSSLTFSVIYNTGQQTQTFFIHRNLMLM